MPKLKQLEPTFETIGENTFAITPFPAFKAANLTGELASVLAPLMGALAPLASGVKVGENGTDASLLDIDASKAAEALSNCAGISGDKLETLMKKLLIGGNISVEYENEGGERVKERLNADLANELFCGDVQDMFLLCWYVIRLNFNGFFKRLAARSGTAKSTEPTARPIL